MRKWQILSVIAIIVILGAACNFMSEKRETKTGDIKSLKIGETVLLVGVADEDEERMKGLSGREKLGENEGLLFVFEKEGIYSFWMKDMNFPIDIAWLDRDKRIIHTERGVFPDTYPKSFSSSAPAMYVLEVNAGFFENNKIKIGDQTEF